MARVSEIYGSMVFDEHTMQERLPSATYKQLMRTIKDGEPLDIDVANVVAHAMKEWAIELGATHYTHWFQPLTGITSEKHDSFIDPTGDGRAIMSFSGKELIRGESDASSFPNGGLRATFEARGYTAWDPTSYAFIKDEVLCIPTAFCSYTGEALDKKTPLLRSMKVIEEQAKRVLDLFGEHADRVIATVGAEQECFLISEKDYEKRLDLVLTGRTLFGYPPCKGQELEQHYYGAIRPTVNEFMKELDEELWKLGVPAKTKHNEVAPAQHELAPIFSNANRAIDENLLTMEKMRLLASHHGLVCLQHEKPFEGINGSGKHDNWSLSAGKKNLLDPGENPMENLRFLVFLTAVIEAVDEYQELLRMSVASAGNDHRLGANEAPPAIVSMYLGDELGAVVEALIDDHDYTSAERVAVDLGVDVLPNFLKDNSDRNRTSPFAFTGNKFEFRMVGSTQSAAVPDAFINTILADVFQQFADRLEEAGPEQRNETVVAIIQETLEQHGRILFNGNNYSQEWEEEAVRRGLPIFKTALDVAPAYLDEKNIALFERQQVFTRPECESRYEILVEGIEKVIGIEAHVMLEMAERQILPAVVKYAGELAASYENMAKLNLYNDELKEQIAALSKDISGIIQANRALEASVKAAEQICCHADKARAMVDEVRTKMDALRAVCDDAETHVDSACWPMPTYTDLMHRV